MRFTPSLVSGSWSPQAWRIWTGPIRACVKTTPGATNSDGTCSRGRFRNRLQGQIPAAVATPRLLEVAMGRSRTTHAGSGVTEKQEQFGRLIARGMSNSEACRVVGINRRTGTRWRYGRSVRNTAGKGCSIRLCAQPDRPSRGILGTCRWRSGRLSRTCVESRRRCARSLRCSHAPRPRSAGSFAVTPMRPDATCQVRPIAWHQPVWPGLGIDG